MFRTFSLDDCSANGSARRRMDMGREISRELIQLNTSSAAFPRLLQAFLTFFVGNEDRGSTEKKSQDMFRRKKVTRGISWIECSPSPFARIFFWRFCRRQLSTALFSRASHLSIIFSPNKMISFCALFLPSCRQWYTHHRPSMDGAERECNLILIALLQDNNKTREMKRGTNNENDVYFGFHLMCNWKLVRQGRMLHGRF